MGMYIFIFIQLDNNERLLTQRCSRQSIVVVHELSPSDHHNCSGVIMEAFVRVHGSGDDPRQWKFIARDRHSWCVDSVRIQRSD